LVKLKVWNSVDSVYDYHIVEVKDKFLDVLKTLDVPDDFPNTSSAEIAEAINLPGRKAAGIIGSMQYYKLLKFVGYCGRYPLYRITDLGRENLERLKGNLGAGKVE
jgi:DNA-binding IclR family transcriptional regulator